MHAFRHKWSIRKGQQKQTFILTHSTVINNTQSLSSYTVTHACAFYTYICITRHTSRCICKTHACSQTHVAASLQACLGAYVVGVGMGRVGAAVWMRHHGFGVDTSEACHPVRPSQALSGSVQVKIHTGNKCVAAHSMGKPHTVWH